jgi:hypothetical protein
MPISRLLIATVVFLAPAFGSTLFLVVPNAQTSATGNDNSGSLNGGPFDGEFQLDFGRGQFSSVPGSLLITQFAFRASPGTGAISVTDTSFSVFLSTSPLAPNSNFGNTLITSTFANNLGPDNTLVLSGGAGTLFSSPGCAGPGPCPFDMVFTLTTPFLYNPNNGFLLADFQIHGFTGVGTGAFDVENFFAVPGGGSVATVNGTLGSATGTVDLSGNITQIGYTLVTPEPASYALVLCGLGALAAFRRRKLAR